MNILLISYNHDKHIEALIAFMSNNFWLYLRIAVGIIVLALGILFGYKSIYLKDKAKLEIQRKEKLKNDSLLESNRQDSIRAKIEYRLEPFDINGNKYYIQISNNYSSNSAMLIINNTVHNIILTERYKVIIDSTCKVPILTNVAQEIDFNENIISIQANSRSQDGKLITPAIKYYKSSIETYHK